MKVYRSIVFICLGAAIFSAHGEEEQQTKLTTAVVSENAAQTENFEWGRMLTYYSGQSWSSRDTLNGVAIINPGMEIHPPHVHSEEEYLMVLEGEGTWSVQGKEFPARAGDVLYAAPWDEHGIKNTGKTPLRFVFLKWNPKPVEPMEKPNLEK